MKDIEHWMERIGQETDGLTEGTAALRARLVEEEAQEAIDELLQVDRDDVQVAKELADTIVVAAGGLYAMGLDAEEVLRIVMEENHNKVENGTFREDGKLIVDPAMKSHLKAHTERRLRGVVSAADEGK